MVKRKAILIGTLAVLAVWGADRGLTQDDPESQETPAKPAQSAPNASAKSKAERRATSKGDARVKQAKKDDKKVEPPPPPPKDVKEPAPAGGAALVAPQSSGEPTGEFQPVLQARSANITTCMDKIVAMSGRVIDRPHTAVSTYIQAAPNDNVFQSIIGLTYPNKEAPNGAAIVLAAPINASKCEGETVQIFPTTNSCTAVQAALISNGRTLATLQSLPLLQTKDGNRDLLMPTAGGGCVVVSIGLR